MSKPTKGQNKPRDRWYSARHLWPDDVPEDAPLGNRRGPIFVEFATRFAVKISFARCKGDWNKAVSRLLERETGHILQMRVQVNEKAILLMLDSLETRERIISTGVEFNGRRAIVMPIYGANLALLKATISYLYATSPVKVARELRKAFTPFGTVLDTCISKLGVVSNNNAYVIIDPSEEYKGNMLHLPKQMSILKCEVKIHWIVCDQVCRYCHMIGHKVDNCLKLMDKRFHDGFHSGVFLDWEHYGRWEPVHVKLPSSNTQPVKEIESDEENTQPAKGEERITEEVAVQPVKEIESNKASIAESAPTETVDSGSKQEPVAEAASTQTASKKKKKKKKKGKKKKKRKKGF